MRCSLRFPIGLACAVVLSGWLAGCGDDDSTDENAQTGYDDASVSESGRGATAGRSGSGGSRAAAGRSGSGGAAGTAGARAGAGGGAGASGAAGTTTGGAGGTGGTGGASASGGSGGADAGVGLSDAQIAAVTAAANAGEIQLGMIARDRGRLSEVRAYAQEMIEDHRAAQNRAIALLETLELTPMPNALSTQLEQEVQRIATTLQNTAAADFDLAYAQSQVDIHMQVLMLIDDRLLPSVTAQPLRTDLTLMRGAVQRHLNEAQALLAVVQAAPPDMDAGTEDAGG